MIKSAKSSKINTVVNAATAKPEKSTAHIVVEIIEYVPNSVVSKTILKKSTGNISVMTFEVTEGLTEKTSPFDTYAQLIEGSVTILINKVSTELATGQGLVIPAYSTHHIHPKGGFKMILSIIKSANE